MNKSIIFAAAALLVVILLYTLSREEFAQIPADEKHINVTENIECLECHAPGRGSPLKKDHPPKDQCLECHKRSSK